MTRFEIFRIHKKPDRFISKQQQYHRTPNVARRGNFSVPAEAVTTSATAMKTEAPAFQGDKKLPMTSLLSDAEKRFIAAATPKFPRWIEGYHLTLMTIFWSFGLIGFGYLARANRHWLWLSSLMFVLQWFTDCFDGALGRYRDFGIPIWGFYMDHLLDYGFLCAAFVGYSFLVSPEHVLRIYALLLIFAGFMVSSFLSFAATNEFKITYLGFGPTEMRLALIALNTALIFVGIRVLEASLDYLIPASFAVMIFVIFRTQKYIWAIDMREKQERLRKS